MRQDNLYFDIFILLIKFLRIVRCKTYYHDCRGIVYQLCICYFRVNLICMSEGYIEAGDAAILLPAVLPNTAPQV